MHDSRRIEQAAADWLVQRDRDDWSTQDEHSLQDWLCASTHHRVAFLRLQSAWREAGRLQALAAGLPGGAVPPRQAWSLGVPLGRTANAHDEAGIEASTTARNRARPGRWRDAAGPPVSTPR